MWMRGLFLAWIKNVFLSTLAIQKATICPRKTGCFYKRSQNTPVKRHNGVPLASSGGNIDFRGRASRAEQKQEGDERPDSAGTSVYFVPKSGPK
jgi:hypothetical protein